METVIAITMPTPGPEPMVTDSRLIRTIKNHEYPVVSQQIVADEVGISSERVRVRLQRLVESDQVERATLNENSVVYWVRSRD
jgi:predicted ArsR family transcriptional regulator